MLAFAALCFSLLFSAVLALPLTERDVFNPHITNPHQGTVWQVGSQETVTWETDDIPPDSQLTNPDGRVILGFLDDNSPGLNLQLDHPLAQGFKLREGKVSITVPDVPPRESYIIVLMGDSGNASPAFAITSIAGGSKAPSGTASKEDPAATSSGAPSSTSGFESPPFTGSAITGATSADTAATSAVSTPVSAPEPTATAPITSPTSSATVAPATTAPTTASQSATAVPASASPTANAAWSIYSAKLWSVIAAPMAIYMLI